MKQFLFAWVGKTDLRAADGEDDVGLGPIAQAVDERSFERVVLLSNYPRSEANPFVRWLRGRGDSAVVLHPVDLDDPTDFGRIYEAAVAAVDEAMQGEGDPDDVELTFHISPGTPAMAAVWIILSKTRFAAELIQSSREHGVATVSLPFDISADYLPDLLRKSDAELERLMQGLPPEAPEFEEIATLSQPMRRVVAQARHLAARSVAVLIEGETGTGKELLARAIHRASPRSKAPFVPVNCGALPENLVDSTLFGHARGAFTGADRDRPGAFEDADGGALFLDEVGELPLHHQTRLLRALQERKIVRVGETREREVDVRILAATNRNLVEEVRAGRFRADLFYRLAVGVLRVPPLRDRRQDLDVLIDRFLAGAARDTAGQPGAASAEQKTLTVKARKFMHAHPWPGNVRELQSTILRIAVWTPEARIGVDDVKAALLPAIDQARPEILGRDLGNGFDINELVDEVRRHYVARAWEESHHNKTGAAKLIGLKNYQTYSNWMKELGVG